MKQAKKMHKIRMGERHHPELSRNNPRAGPVIRRLKTHPAIRKLRERMMIPAWLIAIVLPACWVGSGEAAGEEAGSGQAFLIPEETERESGAEHRAVLWPAVVVGSFHRQLADVCHR